MTSSKPHPLTGIRPRPFEAEIPEAELRHLEDVSVLRLSNRLAHKIDAREPLELHETHVTIGGERYDHEVINLPNLVEAMNDRWKIADVTHMIKVF